VNKKVSSDEHNAAAFAAAAMQMSTFFAQQQQQQKQKTNTMEEDEEEIVEEDDDDDDDGNNSLIIVDENHQQDDNDEKQKRISTNSRTQNNHLRCRQCDYEAEDLPDLLVHRKAHASMKYNHNFDQDFQQQKTISNNSDVENDDDEQEVSSLEIESFRHSLECGCFVRAQLMRTYTKDKSGS